jgi:hypothetical protein
MTSGDYQITLRQNPSASSVSVGSHDSDITGPWQLLVEGLQQDQQNSVNSVKLCTGRGAGTLTSRGCPESENNYIPMAPTSLSVECSGEKDQLDSSDEPVVASSESDGNERHSLSDAVFSKRKKQDDTLVNQVSIGSDPEHTITFEPDGSVGLSLFDGDAWHYRLADNAPADIPLLPLDETHDACSGRQLSTNTEVLSGDESDLPIWTRKKFKAEKSKEGKAVPKRSQVLKPWLRALIEDDASHDENGSDAAAKALLLPSYCS